jgi:hypothetical protein
VSKKPKTKSPAAESASPGGEMLLYRSDSGEVRVECLFKDENLWLTQKAVAALFGVQRPAITKHLGNIFDSGELVEDSVCSILEPTAADGKNTPQSTIIWMRLMALHKNFPDSPYAVLDPDIRWFPADEALRETSMEYKDET